MSRTHLRNHCPRCRLREVLCLCPELRGIALETRVVVVMHYFEARTTTNTGRLAALALANSEVRLRGLPGQPMSNEGLVVLGRQPLLLFPSEDSRELTPELAASLPRPITLIVPDGNWRQAAKVGNREPALVGVPRVKLPPGALSAYQLRHHPNPAAVCTLEAIARALGILEGPTEGPKVQAELERVLDLMVTRTLWSKAKLTTEEAGGKIPEAALAERRGAR